jgi:predicted nucleic acid-binding protein
MTAYVDSSCVIAILLAEPDAARVAKRLTAQELLVSSNLLEAEVRSVVKRDSISSDPSDLLAGFSWIHPDRSLTSEFEQVLKAGYVRGADLWHLAVALYLDPSREITFLTLDDRQKGIARKLEFPT